MDRIAQDFAVAFGLCFTERRTNMVDVNACGLSAGPGGVAIGGPAVGLPTELSPSQ